MPGINQMILGNPLMLLQAQNQQQALLQQALLQVRTIYELSIQCNLTFC